MVSVWDSGSVQTAEVSTGSPGAIRFRDHVERTGPKGRELDQGEENWHTIPAFSILRNSAWADASLSRSMWWALANTGGEDVRVLQEKFPDLPRSCLEVCTEQIRGVEEETADRTFRESVSNTQPLARSTRRAWWWRKPESRMEMETGAS